MPHAEAVIETEHLLARLAVPHAVALRLERASAPAEVIAEALGIGVESVPGVLEVAHAKLAALQTGEPARGFE